MQVPIGLEGEHKGVVDLVEGKAYLFEGERGEKVGACACVCGGGGAVCLFEGKVVAWGVVCLFEKKGGIRIDRSK